MANLELLLQIKITNNIKLNYDTKMVFRPCGRFRRTLFPMAFIAHCGNNGEGENAWRSCVLRAEEGGTEW